MYRHRINPRRTAQGVVPTFTATNTGVAGLYNDSTTHRLAVWGLNVMAPVPATEPGFYPLHGKLATLVGPGTVIWTNQGSVEGKLYQDDLASPGPVVGGVFQVFGGGFSFESVPLWILDPGWSLVLVASAPATAHNAAFLWESLSSYAFPPYDHLYDDMGPDFSV